MSTTPSANPAATPATPRKRRRPCTFKQRDVTAAVKAVVKAGVEITGVKIAPDGNILVSVGCASQPMPKDEWDNI